MSDLSEIAARMHLMSQAVARPLHAPMPPVSPVSPPRPAASELNKRYADRLHTECRTGDDERDGCQADRIISELLREIGCPQVAQVYEALDLWRA